MGTFPPFAPDDLSSPHRLFVFPPFSPPFVSSLMHRSSPLSLFAASNHNHGRDEPQYERRAPIRQANSTTTVAQRQYPACDVLIFSSNFIDRGHGGGGSVTPSSSTPSSAAAALGSDCGGGIGAITTGGSG
jgi:hypothetical protein